MESFNFDKELWVEKKQEVCNYLIAQSEVIDSLQKWIIEDLLECETKEEREAAVGRYRELNFNNSRKLTAAVMHLLKKRERQEQVEAEPVESKKQKQ